MASLKIHQFSYGSDNYGVLLISADNAHAACIDAGDAETTLNALAETGATLTQLLITHHHADHTAGLVKIKQATGCEVIGPAESSITGIDRAVGEGDSFDFDGNTVKVLHTPGHTVDMLNYHLPEQKLVFTGDTLFVLGCGRLFEGNAPMMWASLQKLMALPADTVVYCAHEYTEANAAFALSVDPKNAALRARAGRIKIQRADGLPTVPTTLAEELDTNPFLRPSDPAIRNHLNLVNASDEQVFAEIRQRKDNF